MTEQSTMNKTVCKIAYKTDSAIMNIVFNPRSKLMLFFGLTLILFPISGLFDPKSNFYSLNLLISIFSLVIGIGIMSCFIFNKITAFELLTKNKMIGGFTIIVLLILIINMLFLMYKHSGIKSLIILLIWTIVGVSIAMTFVYGLKYILSKCPKFNNRENV